MLLAVPVRALAQEDAGFEETSVFLNVAGYGGTEMDALVREDQLYLPVAAVFQYLKIQHTVSPDQLVISGYFISPAKEYRIENGTDRITLEKKNYKLGPDDLILTASGLYLHSAVYGKVFGLDLTFDFRSLSVTLKTRLDLPVVRENRRELMRQNLKKVRQELIADTTIPRRYPAFSFGSWDWAVSSTQAPGQLQDTRVNLRLGTILAGGETNVGLLYDSRRPLSLRDQQYLWRYVNNDRQTIRQIRAGKIPVRSTATLYGPVIGMQFTNAPTTYRRAFGTYDLADHTEPGWIVELYINNVLVDYTRADASGFFTFKVPLMYGSTQMQLRYYGPWGEERKREETITVPYNFLPEKELEYTVTAGILEDGEQARFSRVDARYGLSERITIGAGTEYLSSLRAGSQVMPFFTASARIGPSLILSGDYTYGVRGKGALHYRLPDGLTLQLEYTRFHRDQTATFQTYLEERRAMVSKTFRIKKLVGYSRLSVHQLSYTHARQTTGDLLLTASMKGVSVNLTTYAQSLADYLNMSSKFALSLRLPGGIMFRPEVWYDYDVSQIRQMRAEFERRVFKAAYLNLSYQDDLNMASRHVNLGLRFDLSFARTTLSARTTDRGVTFSQSLSGGGLLDVNARYAGLNNRPNVGRGGLAVHPFLDLNLNNKRDQDEPAVSGLKLAMNGGRVEKSPGDTSIRILDLEGHDHYLLELNPAGFDNIAYQLRNKTYRIAVEPNKLKRLDIPVVVAGEVSGTVFRGNGEKGLGRIIINFLRDGIRVARTISENDGYFSYLGLPPGSYTAEIDPAQLEKLKLTAAAQTFVIEKSTEGGVADGLELRLADRPEPIANVQETELPATDAPASKHAFGVGFTVVARGTGDSRQAMEARQRMAGQTGRPVEIAREGTHTYQVRIGGFRTPEEAWKFAATLTGKGFRNAFVISHPPASGAAKETASSLYAIIIGHAERESDLAPLQAVTRRILGIRAFPMKKGETFSLQILGFRDREAAVQALAKLRGSGISGYLLPYRVQDVRTVPASD